MADRIVVLTVIACFAFVLGMEVGDDNAKTRIATKCVPQEGETLVSSHQTKGGVLCQYGQAPKKSKWTTRAAI